MKKLMFVLIAVASVTFFSCKGNSSGSKEETKMTMDDNMPMQESADKDIKMVSAEFSSVDPGVSSYMKTLIQNYIAVKNALTGSNETAAAAAAAKMELAIKNFDKSLLTAEQKKRYDEGEENIKKHAGEIANGKLDVQREHFSMMSNDMYKMVKAFGAGMPLYHDYCPMYNDNKGAMWLSETKEVRNPYYGDAMMSCGNVEEMFN